MQAGGVAVGQAPAGLPDPARRGHHARLAVTSFPDFYRQWWPPLVRCLITQASDTRWAQQIAHNTMLAARDNWERLLTYERPDAWLFKVAIRALRRLEARARDRGQLPDDAGSAAWDLGMAAAADDWIAGHLDIVAAIRALPRRQAEVMQLHGLCRYSLAETGEILGIAETAASEHFSRARTRLAELLR
ncbi:MAG TPA: sigma factor-like helix-turn-helix DNA-binding protein [Streptosporangiaceae bacterium]|nr:sigma factor-like helix-turn-helix DNA-binding protein [Streptosporangiaceae bacterium]